jgi:hypothetical protein
MLPSKYCRMLFRSLRMHSTFSFFSFLDKNITGLESISSELEAQLEIYLKMFPLLYADDTVLMSETSDGLQTCKLIRFANLNFPFFCKSNT